MQDCSGCSWARGFRCCFTPLPGCFSPFPHGTGPLSVTGQYSALEGGPPSFGPSFTCSDLLGNKDCGRVIFRIRGSHPVPPAFPCRFARCSLCIPHPEKRASGMLCPTTPGRQRLAAYTRPGLGLMRVRSPLLAQSRLISLPPPT